MASSIFYQFHVDKCLVDSHLLDHFKNDGWHLRENEDQFFAKYEWPDIILSKDIIKDDSIEALGCYKTYTNYRREGSIVLFYNNILETANQYKVNKSSAESLEKIVQYLTTIVLVHEFVHWLMHYVNPGTKLPFTRVKVKYEVLDEIEFHECFAQLFTFYFVNNKGGLYKDIFDWLELRQPSQYTVYKVLITTGVKKPDSIYLLKLCKALDVQSYNHLKALIFTWGLGRKINSGLLLTLLAKVHSKSLNNHFLIKDYFAGRYCEKPKLKLIISKFETLFSLLYFREKTYLINYLVKNEKQFLVNFLKSNSQYKKVVSKYIIKEYNMVGGYSIDLIISTLLIPGGYGII
ncbi:hypothetical protein SKC37_10345 [Aquirufa sp. HETE-83D]|uniref:Uncharacterized protein n=1 Tax=Aquirufa esocilacus TaxID=3096513 RepID=A0ABW6DK32_9BACT